MIGLFLGSLHVPIAQKPNYAFKPIAEQALRSNQNIAPQRLNAALDLFGGFGNGINY